MISMLNNVFLFTDEISRKETPFILFHLKKDQFEAPSNWIRNENNFHINLYIPASDVSQLPRNISVR